MQSRAYATVASAVLRGAVVIAAFAVFSSTGSTRASSDQVAERIAALPSLPGVAADAQPATVTPALHDGAFSGLRLQDVRTGSLFQRMGLAGGDVVESLHTLERADGSTRTIVHLRRDARALSLTYTSAPDGRAFVAHSSTDLSTDL
jgi:hypothetical protein